MCEDADEAGLISKTALWLGLKLNCLKDTNRFVKNVLCAESDACAAFLAAKPTSDFVFQMIFTSLILLHVSPPTPHVTDFSSYFEATSSFNTTSGSQTRQWHLALSHFLSRSGWNQTGCQWFYLFIYLFLFGLKEMCTFHFIRRLGGQSNEAQDEPEGRTIIDPSPPLSQCQKHIQG